LLPEGMKPHYNRGESKKQAKKEKNGIFLHELRQNGGAFFTAASWRVLYIVSTTLSYSSLYTSGSYHRRPR
jgi:hypothetical protein